MLGGKPAVVAPNHLQRQFTVAEPNQSWVTVSPTSAPMRAGVPGRGGRSVSRQVFGWSMGSRIEAGLVLDALVMAL